MKINIKIISVLILFFLGFTLKAQVINVCGADTIILKLDNYQEGVVQWQESIDSINWVDIDGANDSVYKFLPTEEKFYRAVNTFSNCQPEYSNVSFVQLPPLANAGPDRKVPSLSIVLKANNTMGALGIWTILQGNGGSFSNVNDPNSTFTASDSVYKLRWSVTNTCGSNSDSITVEFVQNEYYDELVVVDTTDIILSDSAQLSNGFYKIKFNNPVPNLTDSTVLVGLPNNGFLQKIDSFTSSNDTFMIYTHKANLMDVIRKGAYNIGDVMEMDSSMTKAPSGFTRLNRMPTRADLMNDSRFKSGNYFYIVDDKIDYLRPGVKINQNKAKGNLIDLSLNTNIFNNGTVSMDLEGYYKFNPNFVADLDYSTCWCWIPVELDRFKMGMYNATTKRGYKLTISASASCSLADKEFTLFSKSKRTIMVIGGVPIYIKTTFSVEGEFGAYTTGSLTLSHEFDKTTSLTAGIEYKNGKWSYPYSKSSTTTVDNNLSANAALIQNFKVGPKLEFSIYGTVSPYIQAMLTEDLTLFAGLYNTDPYWTAQVDIGGEITAGVAAEILGYDLFDLNHTWSSSFYKLVLPNKIKMISGNNQSFLLGDPLNNNPKIRVVSSEGFGVPGVAVFFTPLDGGSVTDNKVFTNIHGEAYTKWTPGSTFSRLEANAYGNFFGWRYKMNNSPVTFIANGNYNCSTSSLAANIIENNGVVSPKGINGSPPYQYSTDAISYSSVAPSITTNYGQSYTFYVKDDNNCIVSKAYSSPPDPCLNSTLVVNAFAVGNAIQLKASNGSEPYQFSVDNVNYSSDTIYTNMNIGQFYAFVIDDLGCKDSTTVDIKTNQPAINANFSADSLIFEVGDTVQFLNQSNNAYSFQWDFGDGNSSTLENPKHAYNSSGYKDISLNVSNVYGSDNHNMNNYIDVGYAPSPDFSCQSSAVLNHPVTFTDISTNNPSSWLWIIGTDTLTQQNPVYYFTNSGYHSVKLIACNKYGKSSITKTNIIEILDAPVADFYCSDSTGGIGSGGDQITFYDNSNGIVNSWLWDFGDGNNSTIQNPDYLYSSTGLYDVKLIISDGYNVDSITKINLIDIGIPPIANYNASSDTTIIGNSIQFTNQSVNAVSYFWDFGDGITSTLQNPTHSYNLVGNYTVKLLAANNYGTDSIVHSNIINVGDIPSATFNYYDSTKAIGDTINFNNNTLEIANQPNTYKWYFGDGDSSIIENPKHAYNANGFYDITLIASNIYGLDTIHRPNYIEIGDKPVVGFIASEDTIAVGDTVFFSDTSTNNPNQWLWLFDGSWNNATTTANTYFVFDTAGIYNVKLGAINDYGSDIDSMYIYVGNPPAAGFIASNDTILAGDTIYFTDTSTYNPTSWLWNFGDGNTSTSQNPTHTYITAGIYTVSLTVTNLYGNDILTKTSYIYVQQYTPSVLAAFSMDKNTAHIGDSVQFTDLSTGSPASWLWHFGDGDSSSLQNPVHKYNTAGTFEIKLLISDSLSSDTAVKTLIILSLEDGLVAYYPFSGNSADSSGNGHHGTEYGGVSLTTDKMGNPNSAYNFDGVNDYIKVNDHDSLDLTDNMTISAWIKIDNFSFLAGIVSKYHTYQSNGFTFRLGYSSPYKGLNCNGRRTSETLLQANTWYHIVSVVENNVVNIYVDGQVVSTAYSVVPAQSNSNFMSIGMDYSSSARYFDGIIDEVRLYNRPLSLSEIQTLYSTDYTQSQTISGFTMSQDTLLVGDTLQLTDTSANNPTSWNWNFGDGNTSNIQNPEHVYATPGDYTITLIASNSSGSDTSITQVKVYSLNQALLAYYPFSGNANDSSGNSEHLTVNGASLTSDRFGNPNSAYYFDGIDDYLKNASPNFAMGEDSSFTVSLWVNSTGTGRFFWHGLLLNQGGSGKFVYFMAAASTQNSQLGVAKQGLAWTWTYYPNSYNTWEHWVFVYDNGQIKLYKNGTEVASNTYTKAGATTSTMPFYLGCESGVSGYLNGKIDEVRIYRRALSTFEIQKLY